MGIRLPSWRLKGALRGLHLWLGLIAGLFIVAMGLSGFIIEFRPILERIAAPKVPGGTAGAAALVAVEHGLTSVYPGARVSAIGFPETPREPLLVQAETPDQQRLQVFIDPASGRVLGVKRKWAWLDWTVDLHQNLLMGKTGRSLTGIIGAALLLLSLSGLFSWLAGRRDWKRTLAPPPGGTWRRVTYHWHVFAGLWVNLFLVVVSLSGIALAYPDTLLRKPSAKIRASRATTDDLRPLDDYVRAAVAAVPGGAIRELRVSNRGRSAVSASISAPGDIRPKGGSVVLLDRQSARVLSVSHSSTLADLANAIHKTELGGWPVRLGWSLLGLAPAFLFVSGLQIWWNRRRSIQSTLSDRGERVTREAESLVRG